MRLLQSFAVLASFIVFAFASTSKDVIADVNTITTNANTLDKALNALPSSGGTLSEALAIHTNAVNLGTAIQKATSDVTGAPKPFSEADATMILNGLQSLEPTISDSAKELVAKKAVIAALPLGGATELVKQDVNNLNTDVVAFASALAAALPADQATTLTKIKNNVEAALATVIKAYT